MVSHRLRPVRFARAVVALGSLAALLGWQGACRSTPLLAPTGTTITLLADTDLLPSNGSAEITALLVQNSGTTSTGTASNTGASSTGTSGGTVHDGTHVFFVTTLGHMEPAEAKTTAGRATVKLVADGESGTATITAYSGGASQTLTLPVGAAASAASTTAAPSAAPLRPVR